MKGHKKRLDSFSPDRSWNLFLDRDGVVNRKLPGDYVKDWEHFEFLPGSLEAIRIFSGFFRKIFIVTNQQGIGKGLMTAEQLEALHRQMLTVIHDQGGRIDQIYYCPDLEDSGSLYRKPNIGMALAARKDHPGIRFRESVMAGDSISDMIFGKKTGMQTILISTDRLPALKHASLIDLTFPDLLHFARFLMTK
ncbi:MAG TPA: HAD family hydrolase [Bacteroidales bacterium]|nr:HAD family hydrolase [Bacteroidales bacterium]HSA43256.1 HAD family hydrolase [Bacteroidales bacterium]